MIFTEKLEYVGMPGQCFYCKQKGHVLKDCSKKQKGFRSQNVTSNKHTDVNHVNLDKSQQSHLVEGTEKGEKYSAIQGWDVETNSKATLNTQ